MRKIVKRIFKLIVLFVFLGDLCFAEIATPTLEGLIEVSPYIVIGKISKVTVYHGVKVAEVEVNDILKGKPAVRKLFLLAENGGGCDITQVIPNETTLLFLEKAGSFGHTGWLMDKLDDVVYKDPRGSIEKFKGILTGTPLLRIAWFGHGRMPIKKTDTSAYAAFISGVKLPQTLRTVSEFDPECSTYTCVPFDDFLALVKEKINERKTRKKD